MTVAKIIFLFVQISTLATAAPAWVHQDSKDIGVFRLTPSGDLFVSTDGGSRVLNRSTGKVVWSSDVLKKCGKLAPNPRYEFKCEFDRVGDLNIEMVSSDRPKFIGHNASDGHLVVVDLNTGLPIFNAADHSVGKIREYVYSDPVDAVILFAEGKGDKHAIAVVRLSDGRIAWQADAPVKDDPIWLGVLDDGSALIYGKNQAGKQTIAEINLKAGRIAWSNSSVLREDVREQGPRMVGAGKWRAKSFRKVPLIADTETSVIAFITKDGPFRLDRSGKVLWQARHLAGQDPSQMIYDEGVLYVIQNREVFAIDSKDGQTVWQHKTRFDPLLIELCKNGLLVWSERNLDLIALRSGTPTWSEPLRIPSLKDWVRSWNVFDALPDLRVRSPHLFEGGRIYIAGPNELAEVNPVDGKISILGNYDFQGGEVPESLESVDGDFILISHQNILKLDRNGKTIYRHFYKAPGLSGWAKLGVVGVSWGQGLIYAQRYRFRVVANFERYAYMHFENREDDDERKFGFVRLDKSSGEEKGTLWLNTRNPAIAFDKTSEMLFFKQDDKVIQALRFDAQSD